ERVDGLVAVRAEPFAIRTELVAGVDRGQRRRDPARLERVRRVRARPDRLEPELLAGLEDGLAGLVVRLVRAPELEPGSAGHAVAQRADELPGDVHGAHPEELDVLDRPAVHRLEHLPRLRALDLEAPEPPHDPLARGAHRRAIVLLDLDVIAARLALELQPVRRGSATDEHELVLRQVEEDPVADDVA